jgi:hypothetical protein
MVLESGKKLTVRASAITTTRKIPRLRASLEEKGVPTDLGVIITCTIVASMEALEVLRFGTHKSRTTALNSYALVHMQPASGIILPKVFWP